MIKGFVVNLLIIIVLTVLVVLGAFEGVFSLIHIVDSLFIVSILTFFIGLLTFSNATEVLKSTGYVLKTMFTPQNTKRYQKFYEHQEEKKEVKAKMAGFSTLLVGGIAMIIDIILSLLIYNGIL